MIRYILVSIFFTGCYICAGLGADAVSCDTGYYWNGASCAECGGNEYYCPGGTAVYNSRYIRVEYIQSDGAAYINTKMRPSLSTALYLHFDNTADCESGDNRVIFGSRTTVSDFDSFTVATHDLYGNGLHFDVFGMSRINTAICGDTTILIDKDSYSINGVRTDWNTDDEYTGNEWDMFLFAWNTSNSLQYSSQSKLYEYKLWNGDVLIQDFVPVYDVVNDVYGMFDNVSQTFFGNVGAGRFLGSTETFGQEACPTGAYCPAGATVPIPCPAGTANPNTGADSASACVACPAGSYSAVGASTCSVAEDGYYTTGCNAGGTNCTGRAQCPATHPSSNWAAQNINDCYRVCLGGSYMANASDTKCADVGTGHWAARSETFYPNAGSRNACPTGTTTTGASYGADEGADCGRVLRIGDTKLHLRSAKKTSPSLAVAVEGAVFYANMSQNAHNITAGSSRFLKSDYNNSIYYIYDDTAQTTR